jgi:nitrate/nitrite transporter NarK
MLWAAAALAVAACAGNYLVVLVALSLAMAGGLSGIGPFQSLISSFSRGAAAAGGLALVNTIGTFGGFLGPTIVGILKAHTNGYGAAMVALAAAQLLSALIVLGTDRAMKRQDVAARQT